MQDIRIKWTSVSQRSDGRLRGEPHTIEMSNMPNRWLINSYRAYMIRMTKLKEEAKRRGLDLDEEVLTGTRWLPKKAESQK